MGSIVNITFACENPARLAGFWASALGYVKQEAPPEFMGAWLASDPDGVGPTLFFEKKNSPKTEPARIHLDIRAEDREKEIRRLVEVGAGRVETKAQTTGSYPETWTVMKDPEGNGFCLQ